MKKDIKKSTMPTIVAPVQRDTSASVSRDGNENALIAPSWAPFSMAGPSPFAGDDAE